MESLVNALKETPVPTILVVAGVLFLLLTVVEQIAGKVVLDPSRRKQATVIGLLLLTVGIMLQFAPKLSSSPAPSPPIGPTPQPRPPIQASGVNPNAAGPLNNTIGTAKDVQIGSTSSERHRRPTDTRYFKFSTPAPAPDKIRILLRNLDRNHDDCPRLTVMDPTERELGNRWSRNENVIILLYEPQANATYFVLVDQNSQACWSALRRAMTWS